MRKEACYLAAYWVAGHRAWSMLSYGHLMGRKRHAVSMQADTRAIVWLRVDDPGGAKHIMVNPCGTEKYIKA